MLPTGGPKVWGNASWAPDDSAIPGLDKSGRSVGGVIQGIFTADDSLGEGGGCVMHVCHA
jgi:hypothetical protein